MCGGPEQLSNNDSSFSKEKIPPSRGVESGDLAPNREERDICNSDSFSYLLELAASNDLEGFQQVVKEHNAKVNGVGNWYGRRSGTAMMVWEQRSPAMIASLFGSVEVLKYILSRYDDHEDINENCGSDSSSALHCAAAGGSARAIETVILLLDFGADLNSIDAHGRKPADVIAPFSNFQHVKKALIGLLKVGGSAQHVSRVFLDEHYHGGPVCLEDEKRAFMVDNGKAEGTLSSFSSLLSSEGSPLSSPSPSSSPNLPGMASGKEVENRGSEKAKEYFVDPSIPDIKSTLYMTDEFRMFSFKIRSCSRAYSHDWTECPFVHPGENARRRDPRRYHYSCVPCPEFRKGACRRGDACEYAHGVFECWLHPAQYRTRLCKDGNDCSRRVCFFAHTNDELRPLFISSGSAIPCPRTTFPLDMPSPSPPLCPGSPLSALMLNSFSSSPVQGNYNTPSMSLPPSPVNSLGEVAWLTSSVPTLHLPRINPQSSRLRSALNARDIGLEDYDCASDFDGLLVNEMVSLSSHVPSTQARLSAATVAASSSSRYRNLGLTVSPTSQEEFPLSDSLSPRPLVQDASLISQLEGQVQSHAPFLLPAQMQRKLASPIFISVPDQYLQLQQAVALESQMQGSPCMHTSKHMPAYSLGSLGRMHPLGELDVDMQTGPHGRVTPAGSEVDVKSFNTTFLPPSVLATRTAFVQQDKRSHSSKDLGAGYSVSEWSSPIGKPGWGSPTGKPEWGVQGEEHLKYRKSASCGFRGTDEPDVSWVHTLVKEGPVDGGKGTILTDESASHLNECVDDVAPGSWMENIHMDKIVA